MEVNEGYSEASSGVEVDPMVLLREKADKYAEENNIDEFARS